MNSCPIQKNKKAFFFPDGKKKAFASEYSAVIRA